MDFIKGIFMFISVLIAGFVFAALTATLSFMTGWTNGTLHIMHDLEVATAADLIANHNLIYTLFVVLFFVLVFITVKVMEAIEADFLWIVSILGLAGVLAGPFFYAYYYHGGLALVA